MKWNFLFDLYGTLIDIHTDEESEEFWNAVALLFNGIDGAALKMFYQMLCREMSEAPEREFDLLNVFRLLLVGTKTDMEPELVARMFRKASTRKLKLYNNVADILDGLHRRGAKVYVLSNAQACFTQYELEELGLSVKFDGVILSSEVGWKKPSEQFFKTAFKRFDLLPQECIYIGNDLHDDIGGARRAGMRSIYIETEQSGHYQEAIPLDMSVADHQELKQQLFRIAEEK